MSKLQYLIGGTTKAYNSLKALVDRHSSTLSRLRDTKSNEISPGSLQEIIAELEAKIEKMSYHMVKLAEAAELILDAADPELAKFDEKLKQVQELEGKADDLRDGLFAVRQRVLSENNREAVAPQMEPIPTRRTSLQTITEQTMWNLPKVKIPQFSGNRWDFHNFWALFDELVHKTNVSNIIKFTRLLEVLNGEAKELISQVIINNDNYQLAIDLLKNKYEDTETTVIELNDRIINEKAKDTSIREQRRLYERLLATIHQLQRLKEPVDHRLMKELLMDKFKDDIRKEVFKKKLANPDEWNLEQMFRDLDDEITLAEDLERLMKLKKDPPKKSPESGKERSYKNDHRKPTSKCLYCKRENHKSSECKTIASIKDRKEYLTREGKCHNCTRQGHDVKDCKSTFNCHHCKGRHHHTICSESLKKPQSTNSFANNRNDGKQIQKDRSQKSKNATTNVTHTEEAEETLQYETQTTQTKTSKAYVPTIQTLAQDQVTGKWRKVSMMVDTGADQSFIKESLAKALNLKANEGPTLRIRTFGSSNAGDPEKFRQSSILLTSDNESVEFQLLHKSQVSGNIRKAEMSKEDLLFIARNKLNVNLDSYEDYVEPEILIGTDQMDKIWIGNTITLPSGLLLLNTKFGYTSMGKKKVHLTNDEDIVAINSVVHETEMMEFAQKRDTVMCNYDEFSGASSEEKIEKNKKILQFFKDTIEKRPEGYVVRLPLKPEKIENVPNNYKLTLKRLEGVLRSTPIEVKHMIREIFEDQESKNILEKVTSESTIGERIHYSPIQPVLTPQKTTTKCRVVVDASAHYRGNESLNDAIEQGPTLLPDILDILIRFRSGETVILADVEKAFLQVHLNEADRDLTRVLWVKDVNLPATPDNVEIYRFTRVLFGLNASPFLLGATIAHHLENHVNSELARKISSNLYVDNLILTFDGDATEAIKLYQELKTMFNDMKMNLREFIGNSMEFNTKIPEIDKAQSANLKVLGVLYNADSDQITMECKTSDSKKHCRRSVSSIIGSDFDPNGLLTPLMLPSKLFQRELWQDEFEYGWDTPLIDEHRSQWEEIRSLAEGFSKTLPRKVIDQSGPNTLLCFCDASFHAAAFCIYAQNKYGTNIFLAKSKVKSLKEKWTIPKLELHAISMGIERTLSVIKCLLEAKIDVKQVIMLSDSEIALSWNKGSPGRKEVGVLVTNRLDTIRSAAHNIHALGTKVKFGHVRSEDNPADLGTRGISKKEFVNCFWWSGPEFCRKDQNVWNNYKLFEFDHSENEISRINVCHAIEDLSEPKIFDRIDTYSLLKKRRAVACTVRAIAKFARGLSKERQTQMFEVIQDLKMVPEGYPPISASEQKAAEKRIIKEHQSEISLRKQKSWKDLNLQLDDDGIIICRGRFKHAENNYAARFPILIEPKTRLAHMIILQAHGKWHCNEQQTIINVRTEFWIPRLRQQVKAILSKCVPCQRYNKQPFKYPDMGDLPSCRVQETKPFENTGLDYFGPIAFRKDTNEIGQCWGCIFTCTATRLIHLQVVTRLDTSHFLRALLRFFGLCGKPKSIISDNAPQFLLADKILQDIAETTEQNSVDIREVEQFLGDAGIKWKCITPYAPWQGAVYERLIRSIKQALYRGIGRNILSQDALQTVFTEIAATLNSRPLTYVGDNINSGYVLRPIDFVYPKLKVTYPIESTLTLLDEYQPPHEVNLTKNEAIEAIQSVAKAVRTAWQAWKEIYLPELRTNHKLRMDKRRGKIGTPQVGQVVLVSDPDQPRHQWKMGQIEKAEKSHDGILREVHLKTANGNVIKRPINLLVPLELNGESIDLVNETNEVPDANDQTLEEGNQNSKSEERDKIPSVAQRYNLRRQPKINYNEDHLEDSFQVASASSSSLSKLSWSKFIIMVMIATLINSTTAINPVECTASGIRVNAEFDTFEMCVRDYCTSRPRMLWNSQHTEVWIPPALKTIDHHVTTKILKTDIVTVYELDCHAVSTCDNIDCVVCLNNLLNPDCHPYFAIGGFGIALYLILMIFYCICKIRIPIGAPLFVLYKIVTIALSIFRKIIPRRIIRKPTDWELVIPLSMIFFLICKVEGCQEVNLFSQGQKICSDNGTRICKMVTKTHVTISSLNQDTCIRLEQNDKATKEIRIRFIEVNMKCIQNTITFTRDVDTQVFSSKRCAHTGSCGSDQCLNVTTTSHIEELEESNEHIGNTYCTESCGGLGCGCFFPMPGCLFYRIYAKERTNGSMEIFQCAEWRERVIIEITVTMLNGKREQKTTTMKLPTAQSITFEDITVTSAWVNKPISPVLDNWFIRNEKSQVALWQPYRLPNLQCEENTGNRTCKLNERCTCQPAKTSMICQCEDIDIHQQFNTIQKRLPVQEGHWTLKTSNQTVSASISDDVTIGLVLTLKDSLTTSIMTSSDKCSIKFKSLKGCYNCANGARAEIECRSEKREIVGNIICDADMFTILCSPTGNSKNISFFTNYANFQRKCHINCGGPHEEIFEINGILKFTGSVWTSLYRVISRKSSVFEEFSWPDFSHLISWYAQFMKSIITIMIIVGIAVATTGAIIASTFLIGLKKTLKWILILVSLPFILCRMPFSFFVQRRCQTSRQKTDKHRV